MISFPDYVDTRPGRTLWPTTSPVALFAVKDERLRPAAIQIDSKPGWLLFFFCLFVFFSKLHGSLLESDMPIYVEPYSIKINWVVFVLNCFATEQKGKNISEQNSPTKT